MSRFFCSEYVKYMPEQKLWELEFFKFPQLLQLIQAHRHNPVFILISYKSWPPSSPCVVWDKKSTFALLKMMLAMNKNPYLALAEFVLPSELVNYFEITKVEPSDNALDVTLEERDLGVEGYDNASLRPNGFYDEALVRDFPLRGRKMTFHVKRRRWIIISTGQSIGKRWDLVADGTRHSKEFASFLKDMLGQIPDYGPLA